MDEECLKRKFAEIFKDGACTKEEFKSGINAAIRDCGTKYTIVQHGNFFGIAKDNELITGLFDSYDKTDLDLIVNLLNEQVIEIERLKFFYEK